MLRPGVEDLGPYPSSIFAQKGGKGGGGRIGGTTEALPNWGPGVGKMEDSII